MSKVNDGGEGGGSQGRAEVLLLCRERRGLGKPFFFFSKTAATLFSIKDYT